MDGIWRAARRGDVGEVERLVGQDPGLLDATNGVGRTALMYASEEGHVGVVRWLLRKGAAMNERDADGWTALWDACYGGHLPVVRLLTEGGADPTIASDEGTTPLMIASWHGHLEVVRVLLARPIIMTAIDHCSYEGRTALYCASYMGRGGVVRALLERGADPTIADNKGITPMAVAKKDPDDYGVPEHMKVPHAVRAEGRRECMAALEVRFCLPLPQHILFISAG
jgi:uncharacterized protein